MIVDFEHYNVRLRDGRVGSSAQVLKLPKKSNIGNECVDTYITETKKSICKAEIVPIDSGCAKMFQIVRGCSDENQLGAWDRDGGPMKARFDVWPAKPMDTGCARPVMRGR